MKKNKPVTVSLSLSERMMNICENLTLIFIALRIAGVIDWSIWKVLSPMIVALGVPLVAGILIGIAGFVKEKQEEEEE